MNVKVCDALCGFGKTSAAIRMMNEDREHRFIFVTQFLTEVDRIVKGCSKRGFVTPSNVEHPKLLDLNEMLRSKSNIATTHSLFLGCTDETKELIRAGRYILVLDETVDAMTVSELEDADMEILKKSGTVEEEDGVVIWKDDNYDPTSLRARFGPEAMLAKSRRFLRYDETFFCWTIPPALFTVFEEAIVLTYMFEAQPLRCFFEVNSIPYQLIGVRKACEKYEFCDISLMDRSLDLRDKVHVLERSKVNTIGSKRSALSYTWYTRGSHDEHLARMALVRKNVINVFRNIFCASSEEFMWTVFKAASDKVTAPGLRTNFVTYNKRASNEFAHKRYLAYCVNTFPRPWEQKYYREHGSDLNGDMNALSTLIQWMFRSAIRNGNEIWIYVPSARMRWLLEQWLENLANGNDLAELNYSAARKGNHGDRSQDRK